MKMEKAVVEFVAFDSVDVIATSGGSNLFGIYGFFDGVANNVKITHDGKDIYDATGKTFDSSEALKAFNGILGDGVVTKATMFENSNGQKEAIFASNVRDAGNSPSKVLSVNGIYEWLGDYFKRVQQ